MRFNSDPDFAALLSGSKFFRKVPIPFAPEHMIAVRTLDDIEIDACRLEGQRKFRKACDAQKWDPVSASDLDPQLLDRLIEREIIIKAYYDPDTVDGDNPIPFFANEQELVRLGSVRVTDLMHLYNEHQEIVNPSRVVSEEEMDRVVAALGKGQWSEATLIAIEPSMLRRCIISMARQLYDSAPSRFSTT